MSARRTPVVLRRGPLSGAVYAMLRYRMRLLPNGEQVLEAQDKQDVSADFDHLVLEELYGVGESDCPDIIVLLDGVADGEELREDERAQVAAFHGRLKTMVERYNARLETA